MVNFPRLTHRLSGCYQVSPSLSLTFIPLAAPHSFVCLHAYGVLSLLVFRLSSICHMWERPRESCIIRGTI